ncbi:MucB/RseB C-terminal domain-containing protein [Paenalcaligenes faecalis]|uniref:MucB/RseB C-terminal domain-containing protein n=1 Tax=Paenalcaligenes faecalis TaxID=2980099 RepID=UPI0022B9BC69|nr:MucB/RseB C-terminal domain-containing protein [Paenalcaligenes faecalis]
MLAFCRSLCWSLSLSLVGYSGVSYAESSSTPLTEMLQQVQQAARQLDYSGVLSYSSDAGVQSMRLVHVVDGKGEHERLEILDGLAREFIRMNDVTQCLIPEQKIVIQEKTRDDRFPAFLTGDVTHLDKYYAFEQGPTQRVGGRQCQQYTLMPRDSWRYGYDLCVDVDQHLLLKLQTLSLQPEIKVLNQVAFANVAIGQNVEVDALKTSWKYNDWKVIAAHMEQTDLAAQGWRIPYPVGFNSVTEITRFIRTERQVAQLVLSDGLASISIFIEPVDSFSQRLKADPGSKKGSIHLYRKRIGDFWLTATGEVPLETLHYLGNNTEFVPVAR